MSQIRIHKAVTLALIAMAATAASASAQLRVVATTPDLASLAKEVGGDRVSVVALAKPTEDPHYVDAKPSHIVTLNRADALIEGGAELELGWLPPLLESSRNRRIAAGTPGRIVASEGVRMLEVPSSFDRSRGDVHSLGNPHFLLDPVNVKAIARNIADHFARIDPRNAAAYRANLTRLNATLDARLAEWQRQLAPYRGERIVTYHRDFIYLAQRFGLSIVGELEPKPGISPSPAHLAQLIRRMRTANARVILVQPYQNRRTAATVARQAGAVVLDLPQQPGARPNTPTYFEMMDNIVSSLAAAFRAQK